MACCLVYKHFVRAHTHTQVSAVMLAGREGSLEIVTNALCATTLTSVVTAIVLERQEPANTAAATQCSVYSLKSMLVSKSCRYTV